MLQLPVFVQVSNLWNPSAAKVKLTLLVKALEIFTSREARFPLTRVRRDVIAVC